VYQANLDSKGNLHKSNPIECYWMNIDPLVCHDTRKRGSSTDRVEMRADEGNIIYGFSVAKVKPNMFAVKLKFLPFKDFVLGFGSSGMMHARCVEGCIFA
jgi:hypothetical protein